MWIYGSSITAHFSEVWRGEEKVDSSPAPGVRAPKAGEDSPFITAVGGKETTVATQTVVKTGSGQATDAQQEIQALRELFADAPAVGKTALENVLRELTSDASETPPRTRVFHPLEKYPY